MVLRTQVRIISSTSLLIHFLNYVTKRCLQSKFWPLTDHYWSCDTLVMWHTDHVFPNLTTTRFLKTYNNFCWVIDQLYCDQGELPILLLFKTWVVSIWSQLIYFLNIIIMEHWQSAIKTYFFEGPSRATENSFACQVWRRLPIPGLH